ncbi:MAG TPA: DNA-processing protein DprA, partial [Candidatus Saccharibacteria bacterium]|nr:DNA-processing protein DprA [Candidatus Saccharibacteria bacterium]
MPRIISRDTLYPKKLKRLADSPRQLFMDGDCGLLNSPTPVLAVVGSRKTSAYGQVVTKQLV